MIIRVVSDTHALIWFVRADPRLSSAAKAACDDALAAGDQIAISSISLVEVIYLAEKGRIDPDTLSLILEFLKDEDLPVEVVVDRSIMTSLAAIGRGVISDMPDRIIAATAIFLGVPLISRDGKIRASSVRTIW